MAILWALRITFGAFHDGRDDSFFLRVEQYEGEITGRQLLGRRAVESGIGRYTNYRPGTFRVTSGYVRDTFSVPYSTLSEYKDLLGSQARHPQFSRMRVGYSLSLNSAHCLDV